MPGGVQELEITAHGIGGALLEFGRSTVNTQLDQRAESEEALLEQALLPAADQRQRKQGRAGAGAHKPEMGVVQHGVPDQRAV